MDVLSLELNQEEKEALSTFITTVFDLRNPPDAFAATWAEYGFKVCCDFYKEQIIGDLKDEIEVSKAANISLGNELNETKKKLEIAKEGLIELARALQSVTVNKLVYDILQKIEGE